MHAARGREYSRRLRGMAFLSRGTTVVETASRARARGHFEMRGGRTRSGARQRDEPAATPDAGGARDRSRHSPGERRRGTALTYQHGEAAGMAETSGHLVVC